MDVRGSLQLGKGEVEGGEEGEGGEEQTELEEPSQSPPGTDRICQTLNLLLFKSRKCTTYLRANWIINM